LSFKAISLVNTQKRAAAVYLLRTKNETISKAKNKIVIKTSINCSLLASPENTALKDALSVLTICLG
jgi:hypothetical protein